MASFSFLCTISTLCNKCVAAIIGIAPTYLTCGLERTFPQHFDPANVRYRVRKFIVFCGYVTVLLFLAILFEDGRLRRPSFAVGITGGLIARLSPKE